jgi:hypothetical protein
VSVEWVPPPPITDHYGRVWTWVNGQLYSHCGMAWTSDMIRDPASRLPSGAILTNPNYDLCPICKGETDAS